MATSTRKKVAPAKDASNVALPVQSVEQAMSQAWQHLSEGRPRQAEMLCAQLVKHYPEHDHAWYIRGLASALLDKHALALKHFDHVKNSPDLLPALAQAQGRSHLSLGQFDNALDYFQQALMYKPDDAQCYYLLGVTENQNARPEEARRFFRQAVLLEPQLGPAHFELGTLALQAGDAARAIGHFTTAATLLPQAPEVPNNLGLCHQSLGQIQQAEASFRAALKIFPSYAEAWFNLGLLLRHQGSGEAAEALDRALQLNPSLRKALPDGA